MSEKNKTVFLNTNFLKPQEMMDLARELFQVAKDAAAQDKFVRVWCDNGKNTGFPYGQVYIDKWTKDNRWKWLKGREVERKAAAERKANAASTSTTEPTIENDVGVEDGGQIELPLETS